MEFVLVVPRERLFPERYPHGFQRFVGGDLDAFRRVVDEHGFFVERERAEAEPAWKQVIPYVAVASRAGGRERLLVLRRLARGGEARLHGKRSVGVGGHLNPEDVAEGPRSHAILRGALREISEEIHLIPADASAGTAVLPADASAETNGTLEDEPVLRPLGLINDDATAVGAVHVGLACVLQTSANVVVREEDVLEGRLLEPAEIAQLRDDGADFETWSSFLLDALLPSGAASSTDLARALAAEASWSVGSLAASYA